MTILSILGMMIAGIVIYGIICRGFYKTASTIESKSMSEIKAGQRYESSVYHWNPKEKGKHIVTVTKVDNGYVKYVDENGYDQSCELRYFWTKYVHV